MDCIDRIIGSRSSSSSGRDIGFVLFFFLVVSDIEVTEFAQTLSVIVDFVFLCETIIL